MTFTGNLIEELMATVERAERRAHRDEPLFSEGTAELLAAECSNVELLNVEPLNVEPWFASIQENADYDSKLLGVA